MAPQSKTFIERPTSMEGSSLILSVVKEAAMLAPIAELKKAACSALLVFKATQTVKENKDAYERLGYDSSRLIVTIWRSFKEAEDPDEWLSADMRDILEDLSHTLENICPFVNKRLSTSKVFRVIFSRADVIKINEFLKHLKYVMQKFGLQTHININDSDVLTRVLKQIDQTSEQILDRNEEVKHALEIRARDARGREIAEIFQKELVLERLKQVKINRQTEDERWISYELKKIEKETKDRKLELERLRVAARELEEANRLMKAEKEEIAQLTRALSVAKEDNRQSNKIRARSNEKKRRPVVVEDFTDDEEEDLQSMSVRSAEARRKLSSASLRVQETEDGYTDTDEEDDYVPSSSRKSPKVKRKRQTSSSTRSPYVDDLMAQFQGFTPMGLGSNARSASSGYMAGVHSNPYFPTYGGSSSPPIRPYGYGVGIPGLIVNTGIGNINNSTISNVGNDKSVKKVYRPRTSQRSHGGTRNQVYYYLVS